MTNYSSMLSNDIFSSIYTYTCFFLILPNKVLQHHDLHIDMAVKITAMWKLSKIVGCKSKKGNINNWINVDKINPEPTSIIVSNKFLISF